MRKFWKTAFLGFALSLLLCGGAFAADIPTAAGIYGVQGIEKVTIVPEKSAVTVQIGDSVISDYHAGAEKLAISYTEAVNAAYYLLIVTNSATDTPQAEDIVYIDQTMAMEGSVTFTAFPSALGKGEYYIYLSSNASEGLGSSGLTQIGSFKSFVPYTLGNVDLDEENKINIFDALAVIDHVVGKSPLDGVALLAADVDDQAGVNIYDALEIINYIVGKPEFLGK